MSKTPPQIPMFTDEDIAQAEDVDWKEESEHWNVYRLSDGTTLKVKLVLVGVKRLFKHLPDGNPIYVVNTAPPISRVSDVPKELKLKPRITTMQPT